MSLILSNNRVDTLNWKKDFVTELIRRKSLELKKLSESQKDRLDDANEIDSDKRNTIESPQEGEMDEVKQNAETLDRVSRDLNKFKTISKDTAYEKVSFGALVHANNHYFLVAAPFAEIDYHDKKIYGISTDSPLFKAIEGMGKGDKATFKGTDYKIDDVI